MTLGAEILFVDDCVDDQEFVVGNLRGGVEAIRLVSELSPARQIAEALRGRGGLAAVHVMAHGEPGRVRFAAGAWTSATLADDAQALASIGAALAPDGALALWSCSAGAGREGAELVAGLAQATGAAIAAADGPVGSPALGGDWELRRRSQGPSVTAPLRAEALKEYRALLAVQIAVSGPIPRGATARSITYYVFDRTRNAVVGNLTLPDASTVASNFRLHVSIAQASDDLDVGLFDDAGVFKSSGFVIEAPAPGGGAETPAARSP